MSDENNNTTDTTAPAATPVATTAPVTAPAGEPLLTQTQVNAIVAKRLAEDRARRNEPAPVAPAAAAAPIPPVEGDQHMTPKQMRDELNEIKLRHRFDKQAIKRGIDGGAAEDMFDLFKMQKPSDDGQWFESKSERFGFKGNTAAPTAATATPSAPTEPPKPAPSAPLAPSAPVSPITGGGLVDLFSLSTTQIEQLGPRGMREHFEKALEVGRQQQGVPQRPLVPQRRK